MTDPLLVPTTRRRFLKGTLVGVVLLAVGGLLPGQLGTYPARRGALKVLTARHAAILESIADAMVADPGSSLPRPSSLALADQVDVMLQGLHPEVQKQTLLLLNLMEHGTPLFGGRLRRFSALSLADRQQLLTAWAHSRLTFRRMAFQALKMMIYLHYYAAPATWAHLGYDGPWVGRIPIPPFEPPLAHYVDPAPL